MRQFIKSAVLAALFLAPLAGCGTATTREESQAQAKLARHELLNQPGSLGDRAMGSANAPVTIIEYASLTCPHCRAFHASVLPKLKRAYIDTGKVRYILREFPIGWTAGAAATVARCAPEAKFFAMNDAFLASQPQWVSQEVRPDAIFSVAAKQGMSRATFDKCLANQAIIGAIKNVKERGRKLGVVGTPTIFVNGEKAQGAITFEQVKAMIDPHLS